MGHIISISYENDKDQNGARREQSDRLNAPSPKCHVTVQYEGWGEQWDETLPYPNNRLARMFTYTKKVKCFVAMLGVRKQKSPQTGNVEPRKMS